MEYLLRRYGLSTQSESRHERDGSFVTISTSFSTELPPGSPACLDHSGLLQDYERQDRCQSALQTHAYQIANHALLNASSLHTAHHGIQVI